MVDILVVILVARRVVVERRENEAGCGFSGALVEYPFRLDAVEQECVVSYLFSPPHLLQEAPIYKCRSLL